MNRFVDSFAVWFIAITAVALVYPPSLSWFRLDWIGPMLMVIMLAMGLTLRWDDFARVARAPKAILLGVLLQFTIMPLAGYAVGWLYGLETALAVGLILVAACPGGTASNVVSYVARADVALSVSMTTISTLVAVIATPFLTAALAGNRVEVEPTILLASTVKVVLIPVLAGLTFRTFFPVLAHKCLRLAPTVAVTFLLILIGGTVANMQPAMLEAGLLLLGAIGTVHVIGAILGYAIGRLLTRNEVVSRTIAIEVSMQNAGIGIALAKSGAFQSPLVALPSIFSGLWSCLIGSILAAIWSRVPIAVIDSRQKTVPDTVSAST